MSSLPGQVAVFFILLALRVFVGVVAWLAMCFIMMFGLLLVSGLLPTQSGNDPHATERPGSGSGCAFSFYRGWAWPLLSFGFFLATCLAVDIVTGWLPWFGALPVPVRSIGCSTGVLVWMVWSVWASRGKPDGVPLGNRDGPSYGNHNILPWEIFFLSPLFISAFIGAHLGKRGNQFH